MVLRTYLYYEERLARDAALQYETFVLLLRVVCVLLYSIVISLCMLRVGFLSLSLRTLSVLLLRTRLRPTL